MYKMLILLPEISLERWLLYGEIIAGAVAGSGIVWETMKGGEAFEKIAQRCVIWGVVTETLFSICLFIVEDTTASEAKQNASAAMQRAATAETNAVNLMKENVELERAIAPRTIDQAALVTAVNSLQRVPIFISSLNREEPKEVLGQLGAFSGIQVGDTPTWSVSVLPSGDLYPPGISIIYVEDRPDDAPQKAVAIAICKSLRDQGIAVSADGIGSNMKAYEREWPIAAPHNAVIMRIGTKPNNFWINKLLRSKGQKEIETPTFCTMEESLEAWEERNRKLREQKLAPLKN